MKLIRWTGNSTYRSLQFGDVAGIWITSGTRPTIVLIRLGPLDTFSATRLAVCGERLARGLRRAVASARYWVEEADLRMTLDVLYRSTACAGIAEQYTDRYGQDQIIKCGSWDHGHRELCPRCLEIARLEYPQGWYYYPGDVCQHGTYVGGCGIDWMCARCEVGE